MKEPEDTSKLHDHDGQPPRTPEEEVDEVFEALRNNIKEKFKAAGLGESVTAVATVILAVAGIVGLVIYGGQLSTMRGQLNQMAQQSSEMQKQTTLLRQQMVGTQAAALDTVFMLAQSGQLTLTVVNNGLVSATGVHVQGQAQRVRLTDGVRFGNPFPLEEKFPVITPKGRPSPSWSLPWHPRESLDIKEWPAGWPGKESITFEGEITYQNGFGEEIRDKFCQEYLPRYLVVFKAGGYSTGGGGTLQPCRNFDQMVRSVLKAERQAEDGADRPDPPL